MTDQSESYRGVQDINELEQMYDKTAEGYAKFADDIQYNGPRITAAAISELVPNHNIKILDVGCGSGYVGEQLFKYGYRDIHGVDLSAGLLGLAEKKGVYSRLIKARFDPSLPLQYPDGYFNVVASSGCFLEGAHLNHMCLPEIVRLLKPGGYMVITTRKNVFEEELGGMKLKTALLRSVDEGILEKVAHKEETYSTENNIPLPGVVLQYQLRI